MMSLDELRSEVESGAIDTVVLAFTDMQGRLLGKRLHGEFFLDDAVEHGVEGCNYLLALEMDMDPIPGYALASWEQGYGDFRLEPDIATLRRIPWLEGTALVLADVSHVNPYLAFAALLAAGLDGIEEGLELPPPLEGNAYESDAERFPHSLREAISALEQGTIARRALGDEVVDHYLNYARTEQRLFDEVVTCYERERLFERG